MERAAGRRVEGERAPAPVRAVLVATLALLLIGAGYLLAVRGDALLIDLAAVARFLCL